jgi:hypothetical protein
MSVGFLSEVFLQPRVTLGWLDAPLGSTPSTSKEIPWRVFCRLPEGGDATHRETVQKLYGKCVAGQLYITDTQERVAAAVFNKTCAVGLDSARPGRRHLSYALGASLLDMILSRKEMLHGGHLIVDLTDVLFDDWVSYVDEFALAILVRSARPLLAKKKAGTDWERLHIERLMEQICARKRLLLHWSRPRSLPRQCCGRAVSSMLLPMCCVQMDSNELLRKL